MPSYQAFREALEKALERAIYAPSSALNCTAAASPVALECARLGFNRKASLRPLRS